MIRHLVKLAQAVNQEHRKKIQPTPPPPYATTFRRARENAYRHAPYRDLSGAAGFKRRLNDITRNYDAYEGRLPNWARELYQGILGESRGQGTPTLAEMENWGFGSSFDRRYDYDSGYNKLTPGDPGNIRLINLSKMLFHGLPNWREGRTSSRPRDDELPLIDPRWLYNKLPEALNPSFTYGARVAPTGYELFKGPNRAEQILTNISPSNPYRGFQHEIMHNVSRASHPYWDIKHSFPHVDISGSTSAWPNHDYAAEEIYPILQAEILDPFRGSDWARKHPGEAYKLLNSPEGVDWIMQNIDEWGGKDSNVVMPEAWEELRGDNPKAYLRHILLPAMIMALNDSEGEGLA